MRSLPRATGAAMWTQNRVLAAPVVVSKAAPRAGAAAGGRDQPRRRERAHRRARRARRARTAAEAARLLDLDAEEVLVLSTGVIGAPLPLDRVRSRPRRRPRPRSRPTAARDAAEAILTTDTRPKTAVAHGGGFTVGGMAKGERDDPSRPRDDARRRHDRLPAPGGRGDRLPAPRRRRGASTRSRSTASARRTTRSCCSRPAPPRSSGRRRATRRSRSRSARSARSSPRRSSPTARAPRSSPRSPSPAPPATPRRARSRAGSRPRRSSRPRSSAATRTGAASSPPPGSGAVQRRLRARRRRRASRSAGTARAVLVDGSPQHAEPDVDGGRAEIALDLGLGDAARELPHERPLLRVRPHQRGVPLVSRVVVKVGGAVAADSAAAVLELAREHEVCVVHGAGPQITADDGAARAAGRVRRRAAGDDDLGPRRRAVVVPGGQPRALRRDRPARRPALRRRDRPARRSGSPGSGSSATRSRRARRRSLGARRRAGSPWSMPIAEGPLNVNADEAAAALALGLGAERLLFLTDVDGVILDGRGRRRDRRRTRDRAARRRQPRGRHRPEAPRRRGRGARGRAGGDRTDGGDRMSTAAIGLRGSEPRSPLGPRRCSRPTRASASPSSRATAATLTDSEGKRYLDLVAGIAVVALGHRHPAPLAAAHAQLDRLWHVSNLYSTEPMEELAAALSERFGGAQRVLLQLGRGGGRGGAQVGAQGDRARPASSRSRARSTAARSARSR